MSESGSGWNGGERPEGDPFTSGDAAENAGYAWQSKREKVLKKAGVWEKWHAVPPADERGAPLEEYLPGGERYEEP